MEDDPSLFLASEQDGASGADYLDLPATSTTAVESEEKEGEKEGVAQPEATS